MRQNSNFSIDGGVQAGVDIPYVGTTAGAPVPTLTPYLEYSESMFRSVVTNKVISKMGILSEVINTNEGAVSVTKNLMFDGETGQPLLTQVKNNFDKPVYNYNFAAHWAYDNMNGAYQNWGSRYNMSCTAGYVPFSNPSSYFTRGDELGVVNISSTTHLINSITRYWVKEVVDVPCTTSGDHITLMDESGASNFSFTTSGPPDYVMILRSGRRNQQSIPWIIL
jgi:hypothetical protein